MGCQVRKGGSCYQSRVPAPSPAAAWATPVHIAVRVCGGRRQSYCPVRVLLCRMSNSNASMPAIRPNGKYIAGSTPYAPPGRRKVYRWIPTKGGPSAPPRRNGLFFGADPFPVRCVLRVFKCYGPFLIFFPLIFRACACGGTKKIKKNEKRSVTFENS